MQWRLPLVMTRMSAMRPKHFAAGKDIFIEKPLCLSSDCEEVCNQYMASVRSLSVDIRFTRFPDARYNGCRPPSPMMPGGNGSLLGRPAGPMEFKILSHAGLAVSAAGKTVVCDPWLVGSTYWRSWWNYPPPSPELLASLKPDCIYITHIHWDHFTGPRSEGLGRIFRL